MILVSLQEMDAVKVQVSDGIEASVNDASDAFAAHKEDFQTAFTTQKNKVRSEQDASDGRLTSKEAVLIAKLEALETSLSNKIAAAKAKINAQLNTRVAKAARDVPNKFNAVRSTLAASAASFTKAQAAALSAAKLKSDLLEQPQWIGGRTSWGLWGWQKFKAGERRDFEGNMGHFSLQNDEWRILKQGMYRLQYWGVMLGSSGDGESCSGKILTSIFFFVLRTPPLPPPATHPCPALALTLLCSVSFLGLVPILLKS